MNIAIAFGIGALVGLAVGVVYSVKITTDVRQSIMALHAKFDALKSKLPT